MNVVESEGIGLGYESGDGFEYGDFVDVFEFESSQYQQHLHLKLVKWHLRKRSVEPSHKQLMNLMIIFFHYLMSFTHFFFSMFTVIINEILLYTVQKFVSLHTLSFYFLLKTHKNHFRCHMAQHSIQMRRLCIRFYSQKYTARVA